MALSVFHGQLKLEGLPSQLTAVSTQLSKQERVGMNEAGSIIDLAVCARTPMEQLYKSISSFKGYRSSSIFTWLTERGDQQGLVTKDLFQVSLEQT